MAVGKDISPGRKNISLKEGLNILTLSFKLIKSTSFNNSSFDCYSDQFGQPWGSRSQIGSLLGYANPKKAIAKIHSRSNHRLDNFSVLADIPTSEGYSKPTILYSFKDLLEICRLSQQPKANSVMDFLWELADNLRRSGLLSPSNTPAIPQQVIPQKNMVIPQSGDYLSSVQETNSKIRERANILETTNVVYHARNPERLGLEVHIAGLDSEIFTNPGYENTLLYLRDSLQYLNNSPNAEMINRNLNNAAKILADKNIKLIFMPCVDKYDLYYSYITDKRGRPENPLFDVLRNMPGKNYTFIDTKAILRKELERGEKDLYWFGDTHWSWRGAEKVCDELAKYLCPEKLN